MSYFIHGFPIKSEYREVGVAYLIMQQRRMFVASYRASDTGREGGRARVGWEEFNRGRGLLLGGGDGIDQIKYFTTHFRRCARRVVANR